MAFSVSTTVLDAAVSHDLTVLADVKDELSILSGTTKDDSWLAKNIGQMSTSIRTHTKRIFVPELVRDRFDIGQDPYPYQTPGGFAHLNLSRFPVLAILSVEQVISAGTTQELTEGTDYSVDLEAGQLLKINPYTGAGSSWEAIPVNVTYASGFGSVVTEDGAIPASSPYTITVDGADDFSCDVDVSYSGGAALTRVDAAPTEGEYSVSSGTYSFAAADAGQDVAIRYAVRAIPSDLSEICIRLVTARYRARGRDPALIQRDTPGVGVERFWFGGAPGQKGPFPPDIEAALDPYCMPVVA